MAALLTWKDEYSVGISEIDRQHKGLIAMMNELYEAMMQGRGGEVLERILDGLIEYTQVHFGTEEGYFEKYGYERRAEHVAEHQRLIADVAKFKQDYQAKKAILSVDLLDFLGDWLRKHIMVSDRAYGPFLNSKGLK